MSDQIRDMSTSLDDIVKNDSDGLTEDQKKVLKDASDILFWEAVARRNVYNEERMIKIKYKMTLGGSQ